MVHYLELLCDTVYDILNAPVPRTLLITLLIQIIAVLLPELKTKPKSNERNISKSGHSTDSR